eukprot:11135342-Alexandrium_andersonii.AAC.1
MSHGSPRTPSMTPCFRTLPTYLLRACSWVQLGAAVELVPLQVPLPLVEPWNRDALPRVRGQVRLHHRLQQGLPLQVPEEVDD